MKWYDEPAYHMMRYGDSDNDVNNDDDNKDNNINSDNDVNNTNNSEINTNNNKMILPKQDDLHDNSNDNNGNYKYNRW